MPVTQLGLLGIPRKPFGALRLLSLSVDTGDYTWSGSDLGLVNYRISIRQSVLDPDTGLPIIDPDTGQEIFDEDSPGAAYKWQGNQVFFDTLPKITQLSLLGIPQQSYNTEQLTTSNTISIEPGQYTWTGNDVQFPISDRISIDTGNYTWTGNDVIFGTGGEPANSWFNNQWWNAPFWGIDQWWDIGPSASLLAVDTGNYTWTGQDINLVGPYRFTIDTGNYIWSGNEINFVSSSLIPIDSGNYEWSGSDVTFVWQQSEKVSIDTGSYTWTGINVNLYATYKLQTNDVFVYSSVKESRPFKARIASNI